MPSPHPPPLVFSVMHASCWPASWCWLASTCQGVGRRRSLGRKQAWSAKVELDDKVAGGYQKGITDDKGARLLSIFFFISSILIPTLLLLTLFLPIRELVRFMRYKIFTSLARRQ